MLRSVAVSDLFMPELENLSVYNTLYFSPALLAFVYHYLLAVA